MRTDRRSEPLDWPEGRRLRAWELHQQGWKQKPSRRRWASRREPSASDGATRLQLERLPTYAPDPNPFELVERYLEHVALRNVCCATLDDLQYELRLAPAIIRHKREVLHGYARHAAHWV